MTKTRVGSPITHTKERKVITDRKLIRIWLKIYYSLTKSIRTTGVLYSHQVISLYSRCDRVDQSWSVVWPTDVYVRTWIDSSHFRSDLVVLVSRLNTSEYSLSFVNKIRWFKPVPNIVSFSIDYILNKNGVITKRIKRGQTTKTSVNLIQNNVHICLLSIYSVNSLIHVSPSRVHLFCKNKTGVEIEKFKHKINIK